jgi:para-nitrobenzyl esterase
MPIDLPAPPRARRWVLLLSGLGFAACASTPTPIQNRPTEGPPIDVVTTEGVVRGVTEGAVHSFKGVPYGAPVGGLARWSPPRPPAVREGVFDASRYGPACEQASAEIPSWMLSEAGKIGLNEMAGQRQLAAEIKSPDCLRLNIWTPAQLPVSSIAPAPAPAAEPTPASEPPAATSTSEDVGLPVMVMFHGGGLANYSAANVPQHGAVLARKGAVVIGVNYRLGPIGYLAGDGLFDGDVLKGNRGFMDGVRALEWIRDNIASFGGDPNNVTLMGQSGGGTAVWSMLASPSSAGLVHRAIIMSGPINQVSLEDQRKLTQAVLKKWGVAAGDADALANVKAEDAASTINTTVLVGSDEFGELSRTYLPNTGTYGTEFLPDDVFTAIRKGRLNDIDLMIGNCDDDAKASINAVPLPDSVAIDMWNGFIGGMIADTDEGFDEMTAKYIAAMPEVDKTRAKEQLQTDALYRLRGLEAAVLHHEATTDPQQGRTYVYQMNWKSPGAGGKVGAIHGLDVVLGFGNLREFPKAMGVKDGKVAPTTQRLSDGLADAWLSFAKTGSPSSAKLPEWPEYEPSERKTMVFDEESEVVSDPRGNLRELWE